MNLTSSVSSIDKRDTSSDGQLSPSSITLWNPHQFDETTSGAHKLHFVSVPIERLPSFYTEYSTDVEQRSRTLEEFRLLLFCHWLIDLMPSECISELFEAAIDIYTSNQMLRLETPSLPPATTPKKAAYGGRVKSPPFVIDFDEG